MATDKPINFGRDIDSLPICGIMGVTKASPFGRGGGVADGEGKCPKRKPSHPLSRELSHRESLTQASASLDIAFARRVWNIKAKLE